MFRLALAFLLLFSSVVSAAARPTAEEAAAERAMLEVINKIRRQHKLAPLSADPALSAAARSHSQDMRRLGFFDHKSPVNGRRMPGDRARAAGVAWRRITENIAIFPYRKEPQAIVRQTGRPVPSDPQTLARDMVASLMTSPGHRKNILDPSVHRVGLGVVVGRGTAWGTQNFKD